MSEERRFRVREISIKRRIRMRGIRIERRVRVRKQKRLVKEEGRNGTAEGDKAVRNYRKTSRDKAKS